MKTLTTTIVFLLLFNIASICQEKDPTMGAIKGKIISAEDKLPVPYASISFVSVPYGDDVRKTIVSNKEGEFELQLPPSAYLIEISSIGYESTLKMSKSIVGEVSDMGNIMLPIDPIQLKVLTVKPLVVASSSEITYNLDQDPERETSTLHQIISKVPMIERYPNGNIYIGEPESSFIFVRNGKIDALFDNKTDINEVLKSLPAKTFSSITVKLMPESRYGNSKYVVSVQTDEINRLFGVVNYNRDRYDFSSGTLSINTRFLTSFDRLRISLGGDFTNTNSPDSKSTLLQVIPDKNYTLEQSGKSNTSGEKYSGDLNFSYDLAKQHFITGHISISDSDRRLKNRLNASTSTSEETSSYNTYTREETNADYLSGGINYQYDFANPKRVLNIVYDFVHSPQNNNTYIFGEGEGAEAYLTPELRATEKNDQHSVQAHYSEPLIKGFNLETGLTYRYRNYETFSNYMEQSGVLNPELATGMQSAKHIYRNYINLSYRGKRLSARVQIISEYLEDGEGTLILSGSKAPQYVSESGFSFMPATWISFMFPKQFIERANLNYHWSKRRPSINMMTSNIDYSNPNYLLQGNPDLNSEDIHSAVLSFNTKAKLNFNIRGSYSDNRILDYWYTDSEDRLVKTYANYGSFKSMGWGANYTLRLGKLRMNMSADHSYLVKETADNQKTKGHLVIAYLTPYLSISKVANIDVNITYADQFYSGMQSEKRNPLSVNVGAQFKLFEERLTASISLNPANFRTKQETEVDTQDFFMRQTAKSNSIPLSIHLSWRLGNFKAKEVKSTHRKAMKEEMSTGKDY